jgi:hypothetical protein
MGNTWAKGDGGPWSAYRDTFQRATATVTTQTTNYMTRAVIEKSVKATSTHVHGIAEVGKITDVVFGAHNRPPYVHDPWEEPRAPPAFLSHLNVCMQPADGHADNTCQTALSLGTHSIVIDALEKFPEEISANIPRWLHMRDVDDVWTQTLEVMIIGTCDSAKSKRADISTDTIDLEEVIAHLQDGEDEEEVHDENLADGLHGDEELHEDEQDDPIPSTQVLLNPDCPAHLIVHERGANAPHIELLFPDVPHQGDGIDMLPIAIGHEALQAQILLQRMALDEVILNAIETQLETLEIDVACKGEPEPDHEPNVPDEASKEELECFNSWFDGESASSSSTQLPKKGRNKQSSI